MEQETARSSWAESSRAYSSKRSTQSSFASSRTSCSSYGCDISTPAFIQPSSLRSSGPRSPTCDRATSEAVKKPQARCPWCAQHFTRRDDFKKHAREFHLSRTYWQCRNGQCKERSYSERQAKLHPNRTGSVDCKNSGPAKKVVLQCDRKHFGCPHCARYFRDSAEYLEHLAKECCPGKAPRSAHQTLQVRALLEQPDLISHVRAQSFQLRGDAEAYKNLWWTLNKPMMADIIEQLEYGVQNHVDIQHPGIALASLGRFLYNLLAPSAKSVYEADILFGRASQTPAASIEKPLPPTPNEAPPAMALPRYDQSLLFQQTRALLQPNGHHYSAPLQAVASHFQRPQYDPMIAGSPGSLDFQWSQLVGDMDFEPRVSCDLDGQEFCQM